MISHWGLADNISADIEITMNSWTATWSQQSLTSQIRKVDDTAVLSRTEKLGFQRAFLWDFLSDQNFQSLQTSLDFLKVACEVRLFCQFSGQNEHMKLHILSTAMFCEDVGECQLFKSFRSLPSITTDKMSSSFSTWCLCIQLPSPAVTTRLVFRFVPMD
ncbi:uncharacterized protein RHO17_025906 [Thomomys bottae]